MSVHTTQAAEPIAGHADSLKVGQFNPPRVADDHKFNVALAVDKNAQLPARFVRQLADLPGKFGRDDLVRRDATLIEFLNPPQLIWL
jgi:hypothetical protein